MMTMNGHDGQPPVRAAASIIDVSTGQWAALGILAAYLARQRSGGGFQHVEATLFDTAMALMPQHVAEALVTSGRPPRYGSGNPIAAPYEAFQAQDAYLFIAAPSESLWVTLVKAIDRTDLLDDPRYATNRSRTEHKAALRAEIEETLSTSTALEWTEILEAAGVPSTPRQPPRRGAQRRSAQGPPHLRRVRRHPGRACAADVRPRRHPLRPVGARRRRAHCRSPCRARIPARRDRDLSPNHPRRHCASGALAATTRGKLR